MAYTATVTKVIDGDTFQTNTETIRLANVNAPEKGTAGALAATNYLRSLIGGKIVTIQPRATDVFGRTVADVWVGNLHVNQAMRDAGYG